MKKILSVRVLTHKGFEYDNPLKLSEAYLISKIAQENKSVKVECTEVTADYYKMIFG